MINLYVNSITFFVEFLITLTILLNGYPARKNIFRTMLYGLIDFIAAFAVYYFIGNAVLNLITTFIIIILFSYTGFKTSLKESIVNSICITALMAISEFICMSVFSSVGNLDVLNTDLHAFVLFTAASKIILLFLGTILIHFIKRLKDKKMHQKSSSPIYLFIYPLCTIFTIFVYWIVLVNNQISHNSKIYISVSIVFISIAVIATYAFYAYTEERNLEIYKLQNELDIIQIDKEYYKLLDFQSENIKRMAHDEKTHLIIIKGMSDNPKINDYIDQIYNDLQYYSYSDLTDNKQLSVILNKYMIQCEAENICFKTNIGVADFSKLSDTDLVSLMSNILDNAIESAKNSQDKRVYLSINKTLGSEALTCINSCDKHPKTVNGQLVTSKQNQKHHGYGSKIISDIVKKYNCCSSWHFDEEKKEFILTIAF